MSDLWRVIVWDSYADSADQARVGSAVCLDVAEVAGAAWAERYPTDIVMLVPERDTDPDVAS